MILLFLIVKLLIVYCCFLLFNWPVIAWFIFFKSYLFFWIQPPKTHFLPCFSPCFNKNGSYLNENRYCFNKNGYCLNDIRSRLNKNRYYLNEIRSRLNKNPSYLNKNLSYLNENQSYWNKNQSCFNKNHSYWNKEVFALFKFLFPVLEN